MIVWWLDLQLPMQSVPITIDVVSRISIRASCSTLCDKVCQWLSTDRWFSQGPPVSSTNKTDHHNITEILLKVALSTIKQTNMTGLGLWVSEWLLFNRSSKMNENSWIYFYIALNKNWTIYWADQNFNGLGPEIFQLYHGKNKLHFRW
jgi:hypothetical protein